MNARMFSIVIFRLLPRNPGQWRRTASLAAAFMLVTIALVMTVRALGLFVATDLGALGDNPSFALDISDTGVAVGYSGTHAFRWTQAEGMADLGTLGGGSSIAWAVNDQGTMAVGASLTSSAQHAFVWTEAVGMTDLGTLGGISPGSYATGVNDSALVVGISWRKASQDFFTSTLTRGFAWTDLTGMVDIGTFGGDTYPNAVNNRGLVVGTSYTEGNAASHPFAWTRAGGLIDLGTLGGQFGEALAVSNSGVVVGYSYTAGEVSHPHPFVWTQKSGMIDLGTLGAGTDGYALAVNDPGVVVGVTSTVGSTAIRAFRWTRAGGMAALDPFDGRESYATGISSDGLVVGDHLNDDGGGLHGFAWTPADGMVDLDPLGGRLHSQISSVNKNGTVLGFSDGGTGAGHATVWRAADSTAPTAQPTQTPPANGVGWNRRDVTVNWNWSENPGGWGLDAANCTTSSTSSGAGTETLTATCHDYAGNTGTASYTVHVDRTAPTIQLATPANSAGYILHTAVPANYSCADQASLSGLASCVGTVAAGSNINTASVGNKTFAVNATDIAGNSAGQSVTYRVHYDFSGFFTPVDNPPATNLVDAGANVSVRFSLGGNEGLGILALDSPISARIACREPLTYSGQTAAKGSLVYNPRTARYTYVWETNSKWAGTCRQLKVRLADGTEHVSNYRFR